MDVVLAVLCLLCTALVVATCAALRERQRLAVALAVKAAHYASELQHLSGLALHDALTGLPNRVLLDDRLRHAMTRVSARTRRGGHVGVLFLDLDGFKAVNDGYGHAVGDEVLATLAARLRTSVRAGDTPARLSGDEFVVVCEGVEDVAALHGAAARLEAAITAPMVLGDRTICLGVSVGAVLYEPDPLETPSHAAARLLAVADGRMYEIKRNRQLRLAEMGVLNQLASRSLGSY
jgi:diguanylate cyclase (GGDEF)-like protein